jgi:hypothetical protein
MPCLPFGHAGLDGHLIVRIGFPLLYRDGARGALRQAVPQPVAVGIRDETGFPVDHLQRALVAGADTQAAAIAFFLVYLDDVAFHFSSQTPPAAACFTLMTDVSVTVQIVPMTGVAATAQIVPMTGVAVTACSCVRLTHHIEWER